MTRDRIKEIYYEAAELGPDEVDAYLERACAADRSLRRRIESLLAARDRAGAFMAGPTLEPATVEAPLGPGLEDGDARVIERPGDVLGRYELVEVVGEGGFGTVYLARQLRPIQRDVALKVIKPGMDTRLVIARFETERQALALMDHPGIARVYDAGATHSGRPYFVMEYVRGQPITRYCDRHRLSIDDRLALFTQVCDAVQHAHQKGIIHRDIKASNVLVTVVDGVATPKVIDFGIAKATGEHTGGQTLTGVYQMVGTPAYMSPEQAMSEADVDTRTDVYALGVLLYELLTGGLPFDAERLKSASPHELERIICEREPLKASQALETLGPELHERARARATDGPRLLAKLRGEPDWIVARAMEKDRTHRYPTALALGAEVRRSLSGEAIEAGPPSRTYRVRKFIRRNRLAVATAGALCVGLLATGAGLGVAGLVALRAGERAERESQAAKRQAAIAAEVVRFVDQDLLAAVSPRHQGKDVTMREALDTAAGAMEAAAGPGGRFVDLPEVEQRLRSTIGTTYLALGDPATGERHLERSLALARRALGQADARTLDVMCLLAAARRRRGGVGESFEMLTKAERQAVGTHGDDAIGTARVRVALASEHFDEGRFPEAGALLESALPVLRSAGHEERALVTAINNLAQIYTRTGQAERGLALFEEALAVRAERHGRDHPDTLMSMGNLAVTYRRFGRLDEAHALTQEVLEARGRILGAEHPSTLEAMNNLGMISLSRADYPQAEAMFARVAEIQERVLGSAHPHRIMSMINQERAIKSQGRYAEAEAVIRRALALALKSGSFPAGHWLIGEMRGRVGSNLLGQERYADAEPELLAAHELVEAALGPSHARTASRIHSLVDLYERTERPEQAAAWRARLPSPDDAQETDG